LLSVEELNQIENLYDLWDMDIDQLEDYEATAGKGKNGRFQLFRLKMATYFAKQSRAYLRAILKDEEIVPQIIPKEIEKVKGTEDTHKPMLALPPTKKTTTTTSTWIPDYKDPDKIADAIKIVLSGIPNDEYEKVGTLGFIVAETTRKLGGKTPPKMILDQLYEREPWKREPIVA
jgi:hypothetical protein